LLTATALLVGCGEGVLAPVGPVGVAQRTLLYNSLTIMLVIAIPTILATLGVAWWFRAGNARARYRPDWSYSGRLELIVWSIPALVILFLGGITWLSSHELDPAEPLPSKNAPLDIEIVSLDWKWLFIYPQQHLASVNRLVAPVGTPLHLRITSASVFNMFFVPRLGSAIYSMNGMVTRLYLQADETGSFPGLSAHFSGAGFSGMSFETRALPPEQFDAWVDSVHASGPTLDSTEYRKLLQQSQGVAPYTYSNVQSGLFEDIVRRVLPPGEGPPTTLPRIALTTRGAERR
jgi:cytochrome o ubiquinol oxidase subunit 2